MRCCRIPRLRHSKLLPRPALRSHSPSSPMSDDTMRVSSRFLQSSGYLRAAPPPGPAAVDPNVLVTLAALVCALICAVGLALVARCAWHRRGGAPPAAAPDKGLEKKAIRALPVLSFRPGAADARLADCPICLAEFAEGDEIRVLPRCGHGFHVACVDLWLASHSSCPSCRQAPVAAATEFQKYGGQRDGAGASSEGRAAAAAAAAGFLP